ncbi:GntR family transcriptional regulator [Ruminococcaceae bacterium OttesenSCG-928-L11]|nr:GntR family transcriptional regulator [Ruminococcaceae bacterium OttesenSCG-928-L11]
MPFKEIQAPSLKALFIREVEGVILSGELQIGDKLPTERELAEKNAREPGGSQWGHHRTG